MERYEYRLVQAPGQSGTAPGSHNGEDGLAGTILGIMNEAGREGWQFLRRESLAGEAPRGWLRRRAAPQDYLVFRRPLPARQPALAPAPETAPGAAHHTPRREPMSTSELEKLRANIRKALGPEMMERPRTP